MTTSRVIEITKRVLEEVREYSFCPGICEKLNWLCIGSFEITKQEWHEIEDLYIDFKKANPQLLGKDCFAYWFDNNEQRIRFLEEFILKRKV